MTDTIALLLLLLYNFAIDQFHLYEYDDNSKLMCTVIAKEFLGVWFARLKFQFFTLSICHFETVPLAIVHMIGPLFCPSKIYS